MTGHLAGLLAQNGQNGGSSSVNIFFYSQILLQESNRNYLYIPQKGKISTLLPIRSDHLASLLAQNGGISSVNKFV